MKVLIELEVIGASPEVILRAVRGAIVCEELQERIKKIAHNNGHGGVKVTAYDVISIEQASGALRALRDELAGRAMQTLVAQWIDFPCERIAELSYLQAEAMLAARAQKPTQTKQEP